MHQMRAVTLSNYLEVATFAGLDGRRMLRQAGISLEALQHPETRIPASAVVRLLERSAAESGCESFGLLVAERRTFASLGPVSLLLQRLPHLRAVMRAPISLQRHFTDVVPIPKGEVDDTTH